jgi:protein-arginine kinase activator protein McsA
MKPKLQLPEMLERLVRCEYCGSEMKTSALAHKQNPFCSNCYEERVAAARPLSQAGVQRIEEYIKFTRRDPQKRQ